VPQAERDATRAKMLKDQDNKSPTRTSRRSWVKLSWRMSASDPLKTDLTNGRTRAAGSAHRPGVGSRRGTLWGCSARRATDRRGAGVGRYIDPAGAMTWAEEVLVYIAVWAVMIIASQLVRADGHVRPEPCTGACCGPRATLGGDVQLPGGDRLHLRMVWYGLAGGGTAAQMLDSAQARRICKFPLWIYLRCSADRAGLLMLIRYVIDCCVSFLFDPATMSVGHSILHEAPSRADTASRRPDQPTSSSNRPARLWAIGFLLLFFGLLCGRMPIFLVLGTCAIDIYFISGQPDHRRGTEQ